VPKSLTSRLAAWWQNLRHRPGIDQDLDGEIDAYLELLVDEKMRAGMPAAEARREAAIELGGSLQVKERVWDVRSGEWIIRIGRDLRFGWRMLRRSAVLSTAIVLTLGLAIGANTAIFGLADLLLFTPLPAEHPEQLVFIHRVSPDGAEHDFFPIETFERLRTAVRPLAGLAAYDFTRLNVGVRDETRPAEGMLVSGNFFTVFGVRAARGRLLDPSDDAPGRPAVVVLSDRYWRLRFGHADSVVGQSILLNGRPVTVVGVLPPTFTGMAVGTPVGEVWLTLAQHPVFALKDHTSVRTLARLEPGATAVALAAKLGPVYRTMIADSVGSSQTSAAHREVESARTSVTSAAFGLGSDLGPELRVLLLAGLLVLLVVSANLANLLLARAIARRREIAVRLALGATHGRLIQQLLTESLMLALLGGGLGFLIAVWGGGALAGFLTSGRDTEAVVAVSGGRILLFAVGLTALATVVFSLVPVASLARTDLQSALKSGAPGARGGRAALRVGRALVVLQVALSLVLLAMAGVLVESVRNFAALEPGFDREHVLLFAVYPAALGYQGPRELDLYQRLRLRLEAIPGVTSATTSRSRLASSGRDVCTAPVDGAPPVADYGSPVSPRYFETMGVPLMAGREFDPGDRATSPPVVILSGAAARTFFPGGKAIGGTIRIAGETAGRTVVGVAGDVMSFSRAPADRGLPSCNIYIPVAQTGATDLGQQWIEARTSADPGALLAEVRLAVREVDSNLSLYWPGTVREQVRELYGAQLSLAALSGVFGILTLVFASIGLLGVVSYAVASRTSELGLRLALGARPGRILRGILRETLGLLMAGSVVGVIGAVVGVRLTSDLVYGVSPLDPASLLGATGLLILVGLSAAYFPARRASRLDPAVTLRGE
jgi:predicted permease